MNYFGKKKKNILTVKNSVNHKKNDLRCWGVFLRSFLNKSLPSKCLAFEKKKKEKDGEKSLDRVLLKWMYGTWRCFYLFRNSQNATDCLTSIMHALILWNNLKIKFYTLYKISLPNQSQPTQSQTILFFQKGLRPHLRITDPNLQVRGLFIFHVFPDQIHLQKKM